MQRGMIRTIVILVLLLTFTSLVSATDWTYINDPSPDPIMDLFFINEYTGWAVGGALPGYGRYPSTALLKTTDSGTTWTPQSLPAGTSSQLKGVYFINGTQGWAVGSDGLILATANGTTWNRITFPRTDILDDIYAVNRTLLYVVGWPGLVYKSANAGASWSSLTPPTIDNLYSVAAPSASAVYVVGQSSILKYNGATWTTQGPLRAAGLTLSANEIQCINTTSCHIAASLGYICDTSNGGTTWSCNLAPSAVGFASLSYLNATSAWAVGANIVHTNTISSWETESVNRALPFQLRSVQVLPLHCAGNQNILGFTVGDSSSGPSSFFRRGEVPAAPSLPPIPDCRSGQYTNHYDQHYCLVSYDCVPDTLRAEPRNENPVARPAPRCLPVMNDCGARFIPRWEYNATGCPVRYSCVRRTKTIVGQAFFGESEGGLQGPLILTILIVVLAGIVGLLLYARKKVSQNNSRRSKRVMRASKKTIQQKSRLPNNNLYKQKL